MLYLVFHIFSVLSFSDFNIYVLYFQVARLIKQSLEQEKMAQHQPSSEDDVSLYLSITGL